jgi:mannose-1-phosphate guanylyltransferase
MKDMEGDLVAVIMAGGAGTRFWPLSTEENPKQFLKLFDEKSLLQKSFERISDLVSRERLFVLTNKAYTPLVREQLPVPDENIIGEPFRRDTAAAVCLGALLARHRFGNPVIVTLTADHMIEPVDLFQRTLLSAARLARKSGALYTFGIQPNFPATGYGYLELGEKVDEDEGIEHFKLLRFKEKPDRDTACRYVDSGRFHWNSGMFVWTADAILREMESQLPAHLESISGAIAYDRTPQWPAALSSAFEPLETLSVDYGIMEKAPEVRCVGCRFAWSDVGGWQALKDYLPQDGQGNYCRGRLTAMDAQDNLVFCEEQAETVMLLGVKDLVLVRAGRKTLIVHKDRTEEIKKLVRGLSTSK